ncbi:MAG: hypothetical protein KDB14_17535 [Planctomycetales bacterium]|nr:hypothetical protein [Planctomycetales bacterium]
MSAGTPRQSEDDGDRTDENPVNNASKGRLLLLAGLWSALVTICLAGGVVAGLALQKPVSKGAPKQAGPRQSLEELLPTADLSTAQALMAARRALRLDNNPGLALRFFQQATAEMAQRPHEVIFEIAVCFELLGQSRDSLAQYHLLAEHADNPEIRVASTLGVARCHAALHDDNAAVSLLQELLLDPTLSAYPWAQADVAYQLAQTLSGPLISVPPERLIEDSIAAPALVRLTPNSLLRDLTPEALEVDQLPQVAAPSRPTPPPATESHPPAGVEVLFQISPTAAETQLSVSVGSAPALPVLESFLDAAGLRGVWSNDARAAMVGRMTKAETSNMSLAMLLDTLLSPHGVTWTEEPGSKVVRFILFSELDPATRLAIAHGSARRAALHATRAFPEHPDLPGALVATGNLLFAEQEYVSAGAQYEMVLRRHGQTEHATRAWFNLGKTHLLAGRSEAAMSSFYRVVDGMRGGELRAIAALYVGRLHLEQEQLVQAKRILSRARSMSQLSNVRAMSALLLSAAYLRDGNPNAANTALMEQRRDLERHARDFAALLSAMSQFQTATNDDAKSTRGRTLVMTLSHVRPNQFFGRYGAVIIGEAYAELGLYQEMSGAYEVALASGLTGATAQRMSLALARVQRAQGKLEDARAMLMEVAAGESAANDPSKMEALIGMAELEFQQRHNASCLSMCRELLAMSLDEATKHRVLRMMGQTYSRTGDFDRAALCFSGLTPNLEEAQQP